MEALGRVLEFLGGVLEANWSPESPKKDQERKNNEKHMENYVFGLLQRCLGHILEALGGVLGALGNVLEAFFWRPGEGVLEAILSQDEPR